MKPTTEQVLRQEIEKLRNLVSDYEEIQEQHRENVRRLDVALNGMVQPSRPV